MTSQDLSHAFGRPATASLRGLLPPRNGTNRWPEPPEPRRPPDDEDPSDTASPEPPEDDDLGEPEVEDEFDDTDPDDTDLDDDGFEDREDEDAGPEDAGPEDARPKREERPRPAARRSTTTRRRPSPAVDRPRARVRVASRDHADLLVLLSLRQGPTDGRGVLTRLRETSGGHLDVGEQTIYATLHRLTRNRLLGRVLDPASGRRFYALSKAGERSARARLRDWHALTICVDAVAGAGE